MTRKPSPPPECAVCGASIPPRASACPECGADERTGWRETSLYDGLDLPDSAFADEDAPHRPAPRRNSTLPWYWLAVAVFLLLALGLAVLGLR